MKIDELFSELRVLDRQNWRSGKVIHQITSDSRSVGPGDVFVAIRGSRMDGHDFLKQAAIAKAAVIVYEKNPNFPIPNHVTAVRVENTGEALALLLNRFYSNPDQQIKLVGVTGTNGKTTTSYLLHRLLREKASAAYVGTLWYEFGVSKMSALNTTPSAEVLIPLLSDMAKQKVGYCIMEVSSHALEQRRVHGLQYELGIFTQLTQDHLDYHHDLENYFQAKKRLFDGPKAPRQILTNNDCQYGQRIRSGRKNAKTFSIEGSADFRAENIETSFQGSRFDLVLERDAFLFKLECL